MPKVKKHDVQMAKRGAYLHLIRSGKKASVVPNKKKKASRNFCRGN